MKLNVDRAAKGKLGPAGFCFCPFLISQAAKEPCWQNAMTEELLAFEVNDTRDLAPRPYSVSLSGSKWIYSIKVKSDGTLDRYKAWLVAQGFKQEY